MSQAKTGILFANLGTPKHLHRSGKTLSATILSDDARCGIPKTAVVAITAWRDSPIRSPRVAKLYQSVWMEEGSPLMVYSRRQRKRWLPACRICLSHSA